MQQRGKIMLTKLELQTLRTVEYLDSVVNPPDKIRTSSKDGT